MTLSRISFLFFSLVSCSSFVVAQQSSETSDPDSLFFHSIRLHQAGQYDDARSVLRGLLNRFPLYHDARIAYGRLLGWDSQYNAALSQIDSVLSFQPTNTEARLTKAQILAWNKRYLPADDILLALAQEEPTSSFYRSELAKVYLWGGTFSHHLDRILTTFLTPGSIMGADKGGSAR